ncbi:hypothetical protein PoB_000846800 [Plakobranchus ocellatus]|uniref:HTH psq-type domain-containing protein n=1 Tax=Plakobranchus ocellatus TaxID=259542 RepID=A0AAV3YHG7_9GAST|nr:hypothetical protein PoB_000846800 [Plakobranchus ocellatus]
MARKKKGIYRNYTTQDLRDAIAAVNDGIPKAQAARMFDVPRQTIIDHISGKCSVEKPQGRPTCIPREVEAEVVKRTIECAESGFPHTKKMLLHKIAEPTAASQEQSDLDLLAMAINESGIILDLSHLDDVAPSMNSFDDNNPIISENKTPLNTTISSTISPLWNAEVAEIFAIPKAQKPTPKSERAITTHRILTSDELKPRKPPKSRKPRKFLLRSKTEEIPPPIQNRGFPRIRGKPSSLVNIADVKSAGVDVPDGESAVVSLKFGPVRTKGGRKGHDRTSRFAKKRKLATNTIVGESAVVDSCDLCGVCGDMEVAREFCVNGMIDWVDWTSENSGFIVNFFCLTSV